nr:hypothetical protein [Escherichia coli]
MTTGTDYQPVSNAEDAFHLKQNLWMIPLACGVMKHSKMMQNWPMIMLLPTISSGARRSMPITSIMPKHQTTTLTAAFTTITPCRRRLRRNRAIPEKEHTHEHEHEEGGHEI